MAAFINPDSFQSIDDCVKAAESQLIQDFVFSQTFFNGKLVKLKRIPNELISNVLYNGAFYHIATREDSLYGSRVLDMQRVIRVNFIKEYIDSCKTMLVWVEPKKYSKKRYYIADANFDFIVILSEHSNYYLLVTGYPIASLGYKSKMRTIFQANKIQI